MSQVVSTDPTKATHHIPPAFLRTPVNPHTEKVKAGLAGLAVQETPVNPTVSVSPAPVVQPNPVVQQPQTLPAAPPFAPPQQSTPAASAVPSTPVVSPPMYAPQASAVPVVDQYLLQQLAAERDQLAAAVADRDKTINNLLPGQQELLTLKQQQEMQNALAAANFEGLETIDPEDAKRISATVLAAAQAPLTSLKKQLEDQQKQVQAQLHHQAQVAEQQRINALNQQVLAAHPDFFQLQSSPAYHAFMSQRDGLSVETRDQRAAREFMAGNTAYVIDMLNQMKGAALSPVQIATVAPVQSAAAAPAAPVAQNPPMTLRELNDLMGTRQITHDEYRARLKELRAANNV